MTTAYKPTDQELAEEDMAWALNRMEIELATVRRENEIEPSRHRARTIRAYQMVIKAASSVVSTEVTPTDDLVNRFAVALKDKLNAARIKYGYQNENWMYVTDFDDLREELLKHIHKGDPRDVAAFCAMLWHHGQGTHPPILDDDKERRIMLAQLRNIEFNTGQSEDRIPRAKDFLFDNVGRLIGILSDAARKSVAPAADDEEKLATFSDLYGMAPNATGGVPSEVFVAAIRKHVTGCESCEGTGRIEVAPDSAETHPCDTCCKAEHAEWKREYGAARVDSLKEELEALLKRHNAYVRSSCQTGCDLEVYSNEKGHALIASYCCRIPEKESAE